MKKKIIYLSHWRFPSEKTMTPLIMKTCAEHVAQGFEVELWVPRRENRGFEVVDPFTKHDVPRTFLIRRIWAIDLMRWLGKFGFLFMVFSFNLSAFILLVREDRKRAIIYGQDPRDFVLPSLLGLPLFIEIHDFFIDGIFMVNKWVLDRTRGLIVTNTYKQNIINEEYRFPYERMIRQPNAVNFEMFDVSIPKEEARRRLGLPLAGKIALYTGHLFDWKGVYTLAEAAAFLPKDTSIYFVGGTEEDRIALKKFVAERNLSHIVFLPHQEHTKIPVFQKAADVLVLPNTAKIVTSKYETSPVKLFEYMASSVPIVASDIPSLRDVVSEKEVWLFTADDAENLGKTIGAALSDREGSEKRSKMARTLARQFTWPARGRAIATLIRKFS